MKEDDYSALYLSAGDLSANSQRLFFRLLYTYLLLLFIAAVISVINSSSYWFALAQSLSLIGALSCPIYLSIAKPEKYWYAGRAMAESIKTITWRFISKAEPFNRDDQVDRHQFRQTLKSIIEQNKDVAQQFTNFLNGSQITQVMMEMRNTNLDQRKESYLKGRINDQQLWYAKKSAFNKRKARQFFIALVITNGLAVTASILKVKFSDVPYWPTDAIIALAANLMTWTQTKRFSELSSSYSLTAHEISLIKDQIISIKSDREFSDFVGDAENAFSREHTQWVARRDT